ncbi:MAG: peptidase [Rheinheimera sp.]|uniref:M14 family metallopeptidase n=1 Tax=Arsukibacterium sp. UBA3155 TaxID=1946058 RepID=UPI000C8CDEBA|nr:M14 family metallocarboxypeptidase [Arsukibacterium sp. UBA3155]MAD74538.1 peptidase [Rheinheimera sp.]|tara:strand:+ start:3282 stop:4202 length:921 start_codon:yes stop_codon:yes gene_type:complete
MDKIYHIGTAGQPWGAAEKAQWLAEQSIKRSVFTEVYPEIEALKTDFDIEQYGELDYQAVSDKCYPLYAVKSRNWQGTKPTVLITGGVHGYETSGVHGALRFLHTKAKAYAKQLNILVLPCISPWGYETINRWNPQAIDPNRSFGQAGTASEAQQVRNYLASLDTHFTLHIDLHETTDSDNSEFRPAKAAQDGTVNHNWNIPDGYYTVDDAEHPCPALQKAIIDSVAKVTHIAEPDQDGKLIGEPTQQPGVINYAKATLGLCASVTEALLVSTTEVYPDSPSATPEQCIEAQVAAITGALEYLLAQ